MVGDGINDVPVLAQADLSLALNSATDLARTTADAILLTGDLRRLLTAFDLARKTRRIIWQNLFWSLGYNITALPLAASGPDCSLDGRYRYVTELIDCGWQRHAPGSPAT